MAWLEATAFADWVRTSLIGYPLLLTLHSIGMGGSPVTGMVQTLAIGSLVIWTVAITTGRLTAYL